MTKEEIAQQIGEEAIFFDGLDEALIGVAQRCGTLVALYDSQRCIEVLQINEEMTEEDAREYFDYNIVQSWLGDYTPVFAWL